MDCFDLRRGFHHRQVLYRFVQASDVVLLFLVTNDFGCVALIPQWRRCSLTLPHMPGPYHYKPSTFSSYLSLSRFPSPNGTLD